VVLLVQVVKVVLLNFATLQDQRVLSDILDHLLASGLLAVVVELHTIIQIYLEEVVLVVHTEVEETGLVIALPQMEVLLLEALGHLDLVEVVVDQCLDHMVT
tara:strand:- start:426 stop:731 length:306 start_codon:yes stop_codon:yes gene_type:complete